MSTSLIKPGKRGANLDRLSTKQRMFVEQLLADPGFNVTQAARQAGYKFPNTTSQKLIKHKAISAALGKAIYERSKRIGLKADDVLERLKTVLFFNPLTMFKKGLNGTWIIDDLDKVPEEIARCVTKVKSRSITSAIDEEVTTYFELEFMSKDTALGLAMKHLGLLGEVAKHNALNINVNALDIARLLSGVSKESNVVDVKSIEHMTTVEEAK